jgi:serine protease Do
MKNKAIRVAALALALSLAMVAGMMVSGVMAESNVTATQTAAPVTVQDTNPAIYVAQKTANSVVGVITNNENWDPQTRKASEDMIAQGSGVVIQEGGYILTNNHVIEQGSSFQILMPSGDKAEATLVGTDSSTDLAVLKVTDEALAAKLVPVDLGSSTELVVGETAIAIGNPGGEVLANTVTSGIVSALEREVDGDNTTRDIKYIQHDAPINSGNSGGGLFDASGRLIGINTLKYAGSQFSSVSFEGLGFAIPVDTAYPIAMALIKDGKVIRPQMGITVTDFTGPDDPMNNYPPSSVVVYSVSKDSPAEKAGMMQYDFITEIDGVRVTSLRELTGEMDKHQAGDTVEVTVVRYANPTQFVSANQYSQDQSGSDDSNDYFGNFGGFGGFGGYGGRYNQNNTTANSYETVKLNVTLEILDN